MEYKLLPQISALSLIGAATCAPREATLQPSPVAAEQRPAELQDERNAPTAAAPIAVAAEPTPISFHAYRDTRDKSGEAGGMLFSQSCVEIAKQRSLLFIKDEDSTTPRPADARLEVFNSQDGPCASRWWPVTAVLGKTSEKPEARCPAWRVSGCEMTGGIVAVYGTWKTASTWHLVRWEDKDGLETKDSIHAKVPGTNLEYRSNRFRDDELWLGESLIAKVKSASIHPLIDGVAYLNYERGLARLSNQGLNPVPVVGTVQDVPPPKWDERGQN